MCTVLRAESQPAGVHREKSQRKNVADYILFLLLCEELSKDRHPVATSAQKAKVSTYTVSAVLNRSAYVSPELTKRVQDAVRELDYHDTFLAADYSHPGDNIPPILATAQQTGRNGADLLRGLATGYEIQVNLVRAICLHKHKIDHVAHLGPSAAAREALVGTAMPKALEEPVGQCDLDQRSLPSSMWAGATGRSTYISPIRAKRVKG